MLAPDPTAYELTAIWSNRLEGDRLALPLEAESRAILASRHHDLSVAFLQHDCAVPVEELLQYFRHQRLNRSAYLHVLSLKVPAPVWAVAGAAERVMRGELAQKEFCPLPGVLRGLAWQLATPLWVEMRRIGRILAAKGPRPAETAERRKHVAARIVADYRSKVQVSGCWRWP